MIAAVLAGRRDQNDFERDFPDVGIVLFLDPNIEYMSVSACEIPSSWQLTCIQLVNCVLNKEKNLRGTFQKIYKPLLKTVPQLHFYLL